MRSEDWALVLHQSGLFGDFHPPALVVDAQDSNFDLLAHFLVFYRNNFSGLLLDLFYAQIADDLFVEPDFDLVVHHFHNLSVEVLTYLDVRIAHLLFVLFGLFLFHLGVVYLVQNGYHLTLLALGHLPLVSFEVLRLLKEELDVESRYFGIQFAPIC